MPDPELRQRQVGVSIAVQIADGDVGSRRGLPPDRMAPVSVGAGVDGEEGLVGGSRHQVGESVPIDIPGRQAAGRRARERDASGVQAHGHGGRLRRRPEDPDLVFGGQHRDVPGSVGVEVGRLHVDRHGEFLDLTPAQIKTQSTAPEHLHHHALDRFPARLPPGRLGQDHDVGPPVAVQIGDGHGSRVPRRQDAADPVGAPAFRGPPGDGDESAGVLNAVGVGTEDQVGETVPVQVSRNRPETPQNRQRRVGERPGGVEAGPGRIDVGDAVMRIVEDQIQVAVLIQIEAMDGAHGSVARHVEVLAGSVQPPVGKVLEAVFVPALGPRRRETRAQPEGQ